MARDDLLVGRFLRAMERVPGIEVIDRAAGGPDVRAGEPQERTGERRERTGEPRGRTVELRERTVEPREHTVELRVRTADDRSVRVQVDDGAIAATVRRVSGDPRLGGLAGADDVTRSFTLFLLELQAALSAPASAPIRGLTYTRHGMTVDQPRAGMLPA